jgi:hypothetical protein
MPDAGVLVVGAGTAALAAAVSTREQGAGTGVVSGAVFGRLAGAQAAGA